MGCTSSSLVSSGRSSLICERRPGRPISPLQSAQGHCQRSHSMGYSVVCPSFHWINNFCDSSSATTPSGSKGSYVAPFALLIRVIISHTAGFTGAYAERSRPPTASPQWLLMPEQEQVIALGHLLPLGHGAKL